MMVGINARQGAPDPTGSGSLPAGDLKVDVMATEESVMHLTRGVGADSVLECVGTHESMMKAIHCTRRVGYVGVPHGVH